MITISIVDEHCLLRLFLSDSITMMIVLIAVIKIYLGRSDAVNKKESARFSYDQCKEH